MFVATVSKLQLQVLLEKLNKETNEYKKKSFARAWDFDVSSRLISTKETDRMSQ